MAPRRITIKGKIGTAVDDGLVEYIAASPPDSRSSFSGSGLPFQNPEQAFSGTPTNGVFTVSNEGEFEITVIEPNSYYVDMGSTLVEPSIYVRYKTHGELMSERLTIGAPIAYRTLTYATRTDGGVARSSPEFYKMAKEVSVRTQEQIILDSMYTGRYQDRFWGTTPPN